ncbi:hypothetical protein HPB48_011424 [Haemaphysalis longicornis]|uniref:Uncharacterized protein n=1 Tax=Haemaphysalis longicornis TaxID=44386 RepID=A0A9J6FNQ8_HAELO|nr:hypothetical protein HPB48_011424 [Haemaphysalis longicornis]
MATASSVPPATQSAAVSPASDGQEREQWPYGYGNFQRFILCVAITGLAVLMCHSQVFSVISGPFANLSVQAWKNIGIPKGRDGQYSQCLVYARPGVVPFNDSEKRAVAECDEWDYDASRAHHDGAPHWNLVCYRGRFVGLGNGVFMSGALLVVPAMGYVADAMGRQPVIAAAVLSLCVSCQGCCFADTYSLFMAARFVASGCVSTIFVIVFIMMYEVTPPERTVLFVSIASGAGNFLSEAFLLALVRQSLGWFALQIIALSPTFVLLPALLLNVHLPAVVAVVVITSRECAFVTLAATFLYITDSFHTGIRSVVVGAGYASGRVGAVCASALELLREQRSEDLGLALVALAVFVSVILLLWLPDEPVGRFPVSPSPRASGTDFQRP